MFLFRSNFFKKFLWQIKPFSYKISRSLGLAVLILPSHKADIEIDGFELTENKSSKKTLEIIAPKARLFRNENLAGLSYPSTQIWNNNQSTYLIQSQEGIIDTAKKDIQMMGDCVVTSPNEYQLKTKNLFYSESKQTISSDQKIFFHNKLTKNKRDPFELQANALEAQLDKNIFLLTKGIQAKQRLGKSQATITAEKASIFPNKNMGIIENNVRLQSKEINLKADQLSFFFHKKNSPKEGLKRIYIEAFKNKKVKTSFNGFDIESKGMNVHPSESNEIKELEALGEVTATHENGTQISSNELKLINDNAQNPKMLLSGDVIIKSEGKTAKCQDAEYFPESGYVKLKRLASIEMGNEVIKGQEIDFSLKESTVNVKKARGKINRKSLGL